MVKLECLQRVEDGPAGIFVGRDSRSDRCSEVRIRSDPSFTSARTLRCTKI